MAIRFDEISELRNVLSPLLDECTFENAENGESGARVVRVLMPSGDAAYLKYGFGASAGEIREEHERLGWLKGRAPVPEVISYRSTSNSAVLLTKALAGRNGAEATNADPAAIVAGMARALRRLHAIPPGQCPFDGSLRLRLEAAAARMEAGLVDEEDFDQARQGLRARDLYRQLLKQKPGDEDPVVTHGDACPENFIFRGDAFVGFIDCGRLGLADRYQDLALASRNIDAAFGPEFSDRFFVEYGEPEPDLVKIEYYRILDEFF